jgi:hypothetical protein
MKKIFSILAVITFCQVVSAQDKIQEKITFDLLDFDMVWYPADNRGTMYFQNGEYTHIVDLGSIWYNREELDVLHTKFIECLDYTNDKSKTADAIWNLPDGAQIESNKQYKWNWLREADGAYKVIRKGKSLRERIDAAFNEYKALIDG